MAGKKSQPLYKRCKKGVGKSGAKKGKLLRGYIWPGGGKCPVKGAVKAAPKKTKAKKSRSRSRGRRGATTRIPTGNTRMPTGRTRYVRSQAAAAARYGAGAEAFVRQMNRTKSSRAGRPPASYSQQASALQRIYGRGSQVSGYYSLRSGRHKRRYKR